MSVIVTANYKGETFEVEIFRDGGLDFPERSPEYEQTIAALGGKSSIIIEFYNKWTKDPRGMIFSYCELPENSLGGVLSDCAEHVLPIYEHKYRDDLRVKVAITATRDFLTGNIDIPALKDAARGAWAAKMGAWTARATAAAAAAEAAASAAWSTGAAGAAARAAAYNVSEDLNSVEWQQAYDAEVAWQIRRFVDCMEAVGQGLPWPPIEATP